MFLYLDDAMVSRRNLIPRQHIHNSSRFPQAAVSSHLAHVYLPRPSAPPNGNYLEKVSEGDAASHDAEAICNPNRGRWVALYFPQLGDRRVADGQLVDIILFDARDRG